MPELGVGFPHSGAFLARLSPPARSKASGFGASVAGEPASLPALPSSPFNRVPPGSCKEEGVGVGGANPGAEGERRR